MNFMILVILFQLASQDRPQEHIRDYLIPNGKNKSVFVMPNDDGKESSLEKIIWFVEKGDMIELLESNSFDGIVGSIQTSYIRVSPESALLTKTVSTNLLGTKNMEDHKSPRVYLKMPSISKKATWQYKESSGDAYNCSAEFSTVSLDGETRNSIKVTKTLRSNDRQLVELGSKVEEYVQGVGLWKVTSQSGIVVSVLKGQFSDPDVNRFR